MSSYIPPISNLAIFDPLVFPNGEDTITLNQADKRYLRYPNAQGTENLATITVSGTASFSQPITLTSTTASNRTINNTYYTLIDAVSNLQTGVIYSSGTNFIYDTNYNSAGHYFYSNTSGGVQTNPLKTTSDLTTITAGSSVVNVTANDLFLNPVGSIDCNGKTLNMTNGQIHNCPLIHSRNNDPIVIRGEGNGSLILDTNGVSRLTIDSTGFQTFQGGMTYNNATDTLTATTFNGSVTNATNASNILVTSDNTSGTYFIPFTKSGTTGNKALFQDDTTGPLTYNPSTSALTINRNTGGVPNLTISGVNGSTTSPYLTLTDVFSGNTNSLQFLANASVGAINPAVAANDQVIAATGTTAENLVLTCQTTNHSGLRINTNFVSLGMGGATTNPATYVYLDNASGSLFLGTNGIARLTISSAGAWTVQGGMSYNNTTGTLSVPYPDLGMLSIQDDFLNLNAGPFGFTYASGGGASYAIQTTALGNQISGIGNFRPGLLQIQSGGGGSANYAYVNSSDNVYTGNNFGAVSFGVVPCGIQTLSSITTANNANATYAHYAVGLSAGANTSGTLQNGMFWRNTCGAANTASWEFVVNNVVKATATGTNLTGPLTGKFLRFDILSVSGGASVRVKLTNLTDGVQYTPGADIALTAGEQIQQSNIYISCGAALDGAFASNKYMGVDYVVVSSFNTPQYQGSFVNRGITSSFR